MAMPCHENPIDNTFLDRTPKAIGMRVQKMMMMPSPRIDLDGLSSSMIRPPNTVTATWQNSRGHCCTHGMHSHDNVEGAHLVAETAAHRG